MITKVWSLAPAFCRFGGDLMANAFCSAFLWTLRALSLVAGASAALLTAAVITSGALIVLGLAFDATTEHMARRWRKSGKRPKGRIGRIIAESDHAV